MNSIKADIKSALDELIQRFESTIPTPSNHRGESTMRIEHFVDLVHEAKKELAALRAPAADPIGWVYQHEETGRMTFCENDGINTPEVFQRLNPRHLLCGPAYTTRPRSEQMIENLLAEREYLRAQRDHVTRILTGIHMVIYPEIAKLADGRQFRFQSPYLHEQIQALSDRIRAIPAEIDAASSKEKT